MCTTLFPLLSSIFMCMDSFWFYLYTNLRHPYQARPRMTPFPWKIDEGWNCPVKVLRKKLQRGINTVVPEFSLINTIVCRFVLVHTSVCHSKGLRCFTYSRRIGLYLYSPFNVLVIFWVFYSFFTKHFLRIALLLWNVQMFIWIFQ
jgi:hypothetical protein